MAIYSKLTIKLNTAFLSFFYRLAKPDSNKKISYKLQNLELTILALAQFCNVCLQRVQNYITKNLTL